MAESRTVRSLGDLEVRIIDAYRSEACLSTVEVARIVDASESNRRRVHQLKERRVLKLAVPTDPRMLGLHVEALIGYDAVWRGQNPDRVPHKSVNSPLIREVPILSDDDHAAAARATGSPGPEWT